MKNRIDLIFGDMKKNFLPAIIFLGYVLAGKYFFHSLCPSVIFSGFPCPGCGMTRAVFSILEGDYISAWNLHPFAYGIILFCVFFCIWRYVLLKDMAMIYKGLVIIFILMILYYIYRMIRYFPDCPPMTYYYDSFLYRLFDILPK